MPLLRALRKKDLLELGPIPNEGKDLRIVQRV
jgi:hypothetical protein